MTHLNEVSLIGTLATQPEYTHAPGRQARTTLNVAIHDARNPKTTWVRVTAFGTLAETARALPHRCPVYVRGRLNAFSKGTLEVVADHLHMPA